MRPALAARNRDVPWASVPFLLLLLATLACGEGGSTSPSPPPPAANPVPRGHRLLGIDVTEAQDGDYDAALNLAVAAGGQVASLSIFWDDYEIEPGMFEADPNWLEVANVYYPAWGVEIVLVLPVLDTVTRRVPADLTGIPLDDPQVIERFNRFLDYVFSQIPDLDLVCLAIGNEIDGILGNDRAAWAEYQAFFEATAAHARTLRPGLPVGSKVMYPGLVGDPAPHAQALNQASDVIMVTYYPLTSDFTVQDPAVVGPDFAALTAAYASRPVYVLEAGYPSGQMNGSSEAQQAEFVRHVFRAWDTHADQIPLILFDWLTDRDPAEVGQMTGYYGTADPRFAAFLSTLGLRTYPGSGTDKQAFVVLQAEAQARGW